NIGVRCKRPPIVTCAARTSSRVIATRRALQFQYLPPQATRPSTVTITSRTVGGMSQVRICQEVRAEGLRWIGYVMVYSGPEPPSGGGSRPPFAVIAPHWTQFDAVTSTVTSAPSPETS